MFLDSDLPPMVAMEIVQGARGPAAIQTIKVREVHSMSVVALCTLLSACTCRTTTLIASNPNLSIST